MTPGVTSGEILGRFLEIPNDGSTWMDGVLMFTAVRNAPGPRIGEERSSPYAARIGGGEEGRWRLSIVNERKREGGWTSGSPTRVGKQPVSVADHPDFPRSTLSPNLPSFSRKLGRAMADEADMMAMMGIAGFGKQTKKRELDPRRFEKNRREEVGLTRAVTLLRVVFIAYFSLGHPCHTSYSVGVVDNPTRSRRRTRGEYRCAKLDRTTEEAWPHPP